jgi:hypothetical protein
MGSANSWVFNCSLSFTLTASSNIF